MPTKLELLKKYHHRACHDLYVYSEDYGMSRPRPGREADWTEARDEVEALEKWIRELGGKVYEN